VGFVGLFIVGIAYHVLPRFKNSELALPRLALPSIALLALGAVLRTITQPWADSGVIAALLVVSGVLELAGAAAFTAVLVVTLARTQRKNYDRYLVAAAAWFVAASAANLFMVSEIARDGGTVVPASRDTPLLEMYFFGFIALFVLGISIRVLPHFISLRAPQIRYFTPAFALYTAGLLVRVGSGWLVAYSDWTRPDWLAAASVYTMAAAAGLFVFALNLHRHSVRDESSEAPGAHELLIRTAYVWLVIAFVIEAWYATRGVVGDFQPDFLEGGGARHALALGFVTQMIFGVGSRALPVFAGKKLHSERLVVVAWILINIATFLRVGHALVPAGSATFRFDHIAVAGALALIALVVFAYNIMRTVRPSRRLAAELQARVSSSVTLGMACEMHAVDTQALISDLTALQRGGSHAAVGVSPRQRILNALRDCYDPEIRANIVDLGLVYEVEMDERRASIGVTLTSPNCPKADQVLTEVRDRVRGLGFEEVEVQLIRDPAWEPSRMTPAARQALGWQ
jgi:metal-sulfur cluster biosynthetic enzyme